MRSCDRYNRCRRTVVTDPLENKATKGGLSRGANDTKLQAEIDRMVSDGLIAHADAGASLARDFESAASITLPTFGEIETIVNRGISAPDTAQVRDALDLDNLGDVTIQGIRLNELLDRGGASLEERTILKRGLQFLRFRKYREAAEWWMLNRPKDHISEARFHCLLTLLLALTYEWSGDPVRAQAAKGEAMQTMKLVK